MVEFVPATPELAAAFYGKPPPWTFRGWVACVDGEPAGVFGIYNQDGRKVAFSDIGEAYRGHRRAIVKAVRMAQRLIEASPVPVYASPNTGEPTAPALLARLGFVPTGVDDILVHP